jgi:hypothetical protein
LPTKLINCMQITDSVLMVRPAAFGFNAETAADNYFQKHSSLPAAELHVQALEEFDRMVDTLKAKGIRVIVVDDTNEPPKPDAVFPNNWFSTTADGGFHIFPMFAKNRRLERSVPVKNVLEREFNIEHIHDWSKLELENIFLEGTGSMVMDHESRIIYACLSERTRVEALQQFSEKSGYRAMPFVAENDKGLIYHTNVMMSIGEGFAVLCPKVISDHVERIAVAQLLETTGHENIYVEPEEMEKFTCNLLQVKNTMGKRYIVISQTAVNALPTEKIKILENHGEMIVIDVSAIESANGGSVRCMMAEIFLTRKSL